MLEIFNPILDRVKGGHQLHESSYLCEEILLPNFRRLVPFLHVKKFVVVGWFVLKLGLSFKP